MKRFFIFFCIVVITTFIAMYCLNNTWIFQKQYDTSYWEDRYNTSQWIIPLSTRIIGDEGLYLHAGYQLAQGGNPTLINAETPPLGKYLVGLVITATDRPFLFGLITYALVIFLYYLLAKQILKDSVLSIAATTLVAVDPLIASQISIVAMDIPYLFFLLLFFILLHTYDSTKKPLWILTSGLAAGCFMAVKFPAFSIILMLIGVFVIIKRFRLSHMFIFSISMASVYIATYFRYFWSGHTLIEFLKVQKWMLHFYQISDLHPNIGSIISSVLLNRTQNLVTRQWESGNIWSVLWPILFGTFIFCLIKRKKVLFFSEKITPISLFLICGLLFYSFVPFWNRYLVILIPFFYLFFIKTIQQKPTQKIFYLIFSIAFLCNTISCIPLLFSTPESDFRQFTYDWEKGFFSDMHERIAKNDVTDKRENFGQLAKSLQSDLTIESISIHTPGDTHWKRFVPNQKLPITITYWTRELGTYTVLTTIRTEKENGRWVFHWDWNYFGEGVTPQSTFITHVDHTDRGRIISSNGVILAKDRPGYALTLTPNSVDSDGKEMLFKTIDLLHNPSKNDGLSYFDIQNRFILYSTPDKPVFLSTIMKDPNDKETARLLTTLQNYSGLTLIPTTYRWKRQLNDDSIGQIVCNNFQLYNLYFYSPTCDGNSGWELQHNETLKGKNGGTLTVNSPDGKKHLLIEQQKKNGEDVIVDIFL